MDILGVNILLKEYGRFRIQRNHQKILINFKKVKMVKQPINILKEERKKDK